MATFLLVPDLHFSAGLHTQEPGTEIRAVRAQAALVRSLLDEVENIAPPSGNAALADAMAAQTVEELTQLAFRMMDAAMSMAPHRVLDLCRQRVPPRP